MHDHSMDQCSFDSDLQDVDPPDDRINTIQRLLARMEVTSYSTAFSGIDSPGTAFAQLRSAATHFLGRDQLSARHPPHLHAAAPWCFLPNVCYGGP